MITVKNPFSGELLAELPFTTQSEISSALQQAVGAFATWGESSSYERSELLTRIADALFERRAEFAGLIREESGKPIRYSDSEVARSITVFRWAAAEALRFAGELVRTDAESFGRPGFGIHGRFPRGVLLGITPYNWPLLTVAHKVAPAIAVGCPMLIKPSIFTPLTVLRLAELFRECGAIDGLMPIVLASDADSAALTCAPEIAMVTFTGSPHVGRILRAQAVDKPVTLELGGNAWNAIFPDVPSELFPAIVQRIVATGFGYAGQGCLSVQNVTVCHERGQQFIDALRAAVEDASYGDTSAPEVTSGPVINARAAERIGGELEIAGRSWEIVQSRKLVGAPAEECRSLLIPPSLIVMGRLPSPHSITEEEIFGPVVTVSRFDDTDQFIGQVNGSRYGLQAGIFTDHWPTIQRLFRTLRVGGVAVNDVSTLRYDHQPFGGGVLDSGQGREGVRYAMEEMTQSRFLALSAHVPFAPPETALRAPPRTGA